MTISIITVAYNAEKTIRDTIQSVIGQQNVDIEYIIIDGGSSDNTLEIVREFGERINTVISEPDKGIYDAMNKGVRLAKGDVIGILNADDSYVHNKVLENVSARFKDDVGGVYADLVYVDQNDTDKIRRTWISGEYTKGAFVKGWMPPHPTFFVRRDVYEKYGGYTLDLRSAADYEFMLRIIHKEEIRVEYLPEVIVKMRIGGQSNESFSNRIKANKEDRLAWKMNDLTPGKLTFIRKPLSKVGQFFKR